MQYKHFNIIVYLHRPFLIRYYVNHCYPVHGRWKDSLILLHTVKSHMVGDYPNLTWLFFFLLIENALRNVSMVFRSHPEWTVVEPIRNIGKGACGTSWLTCFVLKPSVFFMILFLLMCVKFIFVLKGWRFRKHYYLIANQKEEKIKYFLTWVTILVRVSLCRIFVIVDGTWSRF